jgi:hypothetical protein
VTLYDDRGVRRHGRNRIDYRRPRLVLDLDRGDAVLSRGFGFGQHRCDRLARMQHAIERKQNGATLDRRGDVGHRQIASRQDRHNPWHGERPTAADRDDPR